MHRFVRYSIFLFISFVVLFLGSVKAQNKVEFDYIPDVYYTVRIDDYLNSFHEPFIYIDGNLVYCLDPEKLVIESLEYTVGELSNVGLTEEQLKKIELIGYYGHGYPNHDNYKYYLAAQELIWQITRPNIIMSWVTTEYGSDKISVEKEKEEIMFLVNNHNILPNINHQYLTLTLDEEIILHDHDVLKTFKVMDGLPHQISIENNILKINTSDSYIGKKLIELEKIGRKEKAKTELYVLDGYQSLVFPYNNDRIKISFEIETKVGDITIQKIDSETKQSIGQGEATFEGTTFEVYDKDFKLVEKLILTELGVAKTKVLKMGEYFIKEVESGDGYQISPDVYHLEISTLNLHPIIKIENRVIKSTLEITKTYGDAHLLESGAEFSITDKFGNSSIIRTDEKGFASMDLPYGTYTVKQITGMKDHYFIDDFKIIIDANSEKKIFYQLHNDQIKTTLTIHKLDKVTGERILSPAKFKVYDICNQIYLTRDNSDIFTTLNGYFTIYDVPLGEYRIEEIESPYGYLKGPNLEITVKESDMDLQNNIDIPFYNEFIVGKVEIHKQGVKLDGSIVKLDGVKFGIYAREDIIISGITYYRKNELIETLVTDEGLCSSRYLPAGNYYFKELSTIDGYKIDNHLYDFEIMNNDILLFTIKNDLILSKIRVIKKGISYFNESIPLTGVSFGIYALEDIVIDGTKYYQKDELIETMVTKDGTSVSKQLPVGKYYVQELETIYGYQSSDEKYICEIVSEDNVTLYISNEIILGQIEIQKIGMKGEEREQLTGVVFGIYALEDIIINHETIYQKDELIEKLVTTDGTSLSGNLPIGKYYIKELETVLNYELDDSIYIVDINDNRIYSYEILNYQKGETFNEYDIPDTEIKTEKVHKMFILMILFLGYLVVKYAKK